MWCECPEMCPQYTSQSQQRCRLFRSQMRMDTGEIQWSGHLLLSSDPIARRSWVAKVDVPSRPLKARCALLLLRRYTPRWCFCCARSDGGSLFSSRRSAARSQMSFECLLDEWHQSEIQMCSRKRAIVHVTTVSSLLSRCPSVRQSISQSPISGARKVKGDLPAGAARLKCFLCRSTAVSRVHQN